MEYDGPQHCVMCGEEMFSEEEIEYTMHYGCEGD